MISLNVRLAQMENNIYGIVRRITSAKNKLTKESTDVGKCGIRTFRSSVFSLIGAKVPTENFRSRERKFSVRTFAAGNESSRELLFPSKQVCFLTTIINIYNTQMLGAAVKKVRIFD